MRLLGCLTFHYFIDFLLGVFAAIIVLNEKQSRMEHNLTKYFTDELTSEEKTEFLLEVNEDREMQEEFSENQCLAALLEWLPQRNDSELAQLKLHEFMCLKRYHE